jgi:hypothetical protein
LENGNSQQRKSSSGKEVKVKAEGRIKKTGDAIARRADDYCKRIRNRELVITPEADKINLVVFEGTDRLGRPKKQVHSLAFLIAKRMTEYQKIRDEVPIRTPRHITPNPQFRVTMEHIRRLTDYELKDRAVGLLEMIDQANTHGVIREENLWNKLEECQEQNERLKKKVNELEKKNQELNTTLKRFGKVGHIISNVPDEEEDKP